jgi:hypothetical protein
VNGRVGHRGLEKNPTPLLADLFAYGLLVRDNHRRGKENGQIRWIIATLNSRTSSVMDLCID